MGGFWWEDREEGIERMRHGAALPAEPDYARPTRSEAEEMKEQDERDRLRRERLAR